MNNVLIISDTQAPFHHPDAVAFIRALAAQLQPRAVYHVGDEVDQHTLSKYAKNPSLHSTRDEWLAARAHLQELHQLFPKLRVCYSNHTGRIYKRLSEASIPAEFLRSLQQIYGVPGWRWAPHWDLQTAYGTARIVHGQKKKGAYNRVKQTGISHIHGHWHTMAGVQFLSVEGRQRFGMDVGCLLDIHSPTFAYREHAEHDPLIGCGVLVRGHPRWIPMVVNAENRWNRKLVL